MYGNPEHVKAVVRTLSCAQHYTAGVLSFAEKSVPAAIKRQVIAEHLRISLP